MEGDVVLREAVCTTGYTLRRNFFHIFESDIIYETQIQEDGHEKEKTDSSPSRAPLFRPSRHFSHARKEPFDGTLHCCRQWHILVIDNSPIVMREMGAGNMFSNLQTGDKILVVHDGIMTSYPGQTGAYLCLRLQKGDTSDVPKDTLAELQELGWISSDSDEKDIMPKNTETITAEYEYQYANMRLELPEDWAYEIACVDNTAEESSAQQFGINFWPSAQPEALFRLYCVAQPIGLCGTGVTFEDVTLDNGLALTKCTEQIDGNMWVMLIFKDVAGNYALESSLPKELWNQYEPVLMTMLGSLKLGEGCLKESEAIAQAKNACTISYDTVRASFDYQDGSWVVYFYTADAIGGDQTVRINAAGETENTVYGE